MASIKGIPASSFHPRMANIRERLKGIIAWKNYTSAYTTHFERLIGPQGNGSQNAQVTELGKIAEHLDLPLSSEGLSTIANSVYGGTRTFRQGISGRWQKDFNSQHRKACKELIGDCLIELGYEKDFDW